MIEKIVNTLRTERDEKSAIMFEAARLHLLSDVIVARRRRCCGLSSWPNVAQSYAWANFTCAKPNANGVWNM